MSQIILPAAAAQPMELGWRLFCFNDFSSLSEKLVLCNPCVNSCEAGGRIS